MSQIFPKNKEKRPRTSSNEANNSFVKNVTSRVSGLLPSTITKWFSSPSSSSANGSAPAADGSDSSTEDEASDTPVITQPPAKRMRFNTPGTYNHYGPAEAGCSTSDVEIMDIPYSPFSGAQYGQTSRNTFTTPMRPPNEDHEKSDRDPGHIFKLPHTVSSIGQSVANKRKSIFDTATREETNRAVAKSTTNTVPDLKQPSFKPSLLGSPFYPGRTMYGGAASSYINQPNIKQQTVAVVNDSESKTNDDSAISSAARRVMDLLESYSSPLMEARRIPLYTKPKNVGFNTSTDKYSPYANKSYSYKTQELHVPSIASILRLKKKSRLMDTTNAARQIIASHSSASHYPSYPTAPKGNEPEKEQSKMTTKVKSRLTRTNRGNQEELEVATPIKLPTAVLNIQQDKLPQFSFASPSVSKAPVTSTPKVVSYPADKYNSQISTSKPETVTSNVFKFSNPVKVSSDTPQAGTPPKFTFDSPERRIDQKNESKCDDNSVVVGIVKEPETSTTNSKDWLCSECWVKNKPEVNKCVCCGSKQPSQKAKCSVCKLADSQSQKDKCVNCEKMSASQVANPLFKQSSKWKCEDCWVTNEDSAAKCACCGAGRPKMSGALGSAASPSKTSTITSMTNTFGFKPATVTSNTATVNNAPAATNADWKCDDCWISNKSSVDKCAACGGARPGAKQTNAAETTSHTTSFFGSASDKFKTIVNSQKSDKWECSSCLVRNDSEKDKCVCCGAEKENKKKLPDTKFNFGTTANTSFKFGIDPKAQEDTLTKKPEEFSAMGSKLKTQSETNNNVISDTPTFTFTLPTKKIETKTDISKAKSDEAPKMNFTFGIPKQIATSKSLEPTKVLEEEKVQEVPSVDLNAPIQDKPKPVEKFGMSPMSQINKDNNTLTSTSLDANKDTNSIPSIAASSTETPKATFSFGVKTNSKLFDTPPSSGTSTNLFSQPSQPTSSVATTSAPALSLFKPPETTTTTTSLFQQSDLSAKPAPLFQNSETANNTATKPMFSFGNNGSTNNAPPAALTLPDASEKPKFQFTFGSNPNSKSDSPALFKSPFGATDSNVSTNNFALPSGSSNTPSTNILGGTNGLAASNGPAGNALAGNTLGAMTGNTLTGNSLAIGNSGTMTNALGGTNGLPASQLSGANLQTGNALTGAATSLFSNTVQKENVWAASSAAPTPNLFVSNTTTSSLQKPPTFTFGSSTPFNAANNTPAFGNAPAPSQNLFGMGSQNNSTQPSMFSNPVQSPPSGNLFGSPQPANNPTPQMPMFGTPSIGATPAFGSPNPSIPSFEAPSMASAPGPAFNFGGQQATGIFGFGQQQQLQQQQMQQQHLQQQQLQQQQQNQQTGVYSFGGAPAGAPQVQFSIGSGANPAGRRVRKAVRRNPQR